MVGQPGRLSCVLALSCTLLPCMACLSRLSRLQHMGQQAEQQVREAAAQRGSMLPASRCTRAHTYMHCLLYSWAADQHSNSQQRAFSLLPSCACLVAATNWQHPTKSQHPANSQQRIFSLLPFSAD